MAALHQITTSEALKFSDYKRLLAGLRDMEKYQWELYCTISFCTAFRVSDVKTLTWRDILGSNEFIKIEKKTGKSREITIGDSFKSRVKELYELMGSPDQDEFVFCNPRTKCPFTTQYINRKLKQFKVRFDLPVKRFSTHTFRKTFGRYIWESMGKSTEALTLLNSIFRHSSLQTTIIYLGIRQEEVKNVYKLINLD